MKKKYILICIFIFLPLISLFSLKVQAQQFTPGINIGDELIWKEEYNEDGYLGTDYSKYIITQIVDDGDQTHVYADSYYSPNNSDYEYSSSEQIIGRLTNYTEDPSVLVIFGYFVIPGTKIYDYKDGIAAAHTWVDDNITSIDDGYGIAYTTITLQRTAYRERVFNEDGILVLSTYSSGDIYSDVTLFSINGKRYKTIPGYSVVILLGISIIGVVASILFVKRNRKVF